MPAELRVSDAPWLLGTLIVITLAVLIVGDQAASTGNRPGCGSTPASWSPRSRVATRTSAVSLASGITETTTFTNGTKTLLDARRRHLACTNVLTFGLWYWDVDRGGAAARAHGYATDVRCSAR